MEKYIKSLSIILMVATTLFFLSMFGAANGEALHMPEFIITVLKQGANVLIFVVPLLYMGIFVIGMVCLFKKILYQQTNHFGQKTEKFPIVWFLLSFLCFMVYFIFVSMILNS